LLAHVCVCLCVCVCVCAQEREWQKLMWKLVFSNGLDIKARSHALQFVALSLQQPDACTATAPIDSDAPTQTHSTVENAEHSRTCVEKLLWLVANQSPEGNVCNKFHSRKNKPPSFPEVRPEKREEDVGGDGEKEQNEQTDVAFVPCLVFRSKVIALIKVCCSVSGCGTMTLHCLSVCLGVDFCA